MHIRLPSQSFRLFINEFNMQLSIIIPAYNESAKIARDVSAATEFLARAELRGEIIVVDDGSEDDTATVARKVVIPPPSSLRVMQNAAHRGKGYAVRTGVMQSRGEFVMFADSGLPVPYDHALRGLQLLQQGACEVAHASRRLRESIIKRPQPWPRRLFSALFRWAMIYFLKIPPRLTDTQCGFKLYRGNVARELFAACFTDGFMFDIEIILRALRRGYRLAEFPVEWTCDRDSRLSVTRGPQRIMRELLAIKAQLARDKT